jgi:hypothetical protein
MRIRPFQFSESRDRVSQTPTDVPVQPAADAFETGLITWNSFMQCSLEFKDGSAVRSVLAEVIRCLNTFRLRLNWIHFVATNDTLTVHQIPSSCNTLADVNEWMFALHMLSPWKVFETIAASERRIVVNISHAVGDSRDISNRAQSGKTTVPLLPESCSLFHWNSMKNSRPECECSLNPKLSRVFPRAPIAQSDLRFLTHYIYKPVSLFRCFDRGKSARDDRVDADGACAVTGGLSGGFRLPTVLALRRFLTDEQIATGGKQNWCR